MRHQQRLIQQLEMIKEQSDIFIYDFEEFLENEEFHKDLKRTEADAKKE